MISIVIPTYNNAHYVAMCLDSINNQTYKDYEVIIIDDGSDKENRTRLKEISQKYDKVDVYYLAHSGVSSARNFGLKKATGHYITFVDSDDTLAPNCLDTVISAVAEDSYDLVIYGIQNVVHKNEHTHNGQAWRLEDKVFSSASELIDKYIAHGTMLLYSNCNKFYSRKIIQNYDVKFNEAFLFGEDRLFNWDYIKRCRKIKTLSCCLYEYHHRDNASLSKNFIPGKISILLKLHSEKVTCARVLKKMATLEEWEIFSYNDISRELHNALAHIARQYRYLSEDLRKKELSTLLNQDFPYYFFNYGKNDKGKKKIFYLIIKYKMLWCIKLYCMAFKMLKK